MSFDKRARDAGRHAQGVGRESDRPNIAALALRKRRGRLVVWGVTAAAALVLVLTYASFGPSGASDFAAASTTTVPTTTTTTRPTTTTSLGECPITIPTGDFTPPSEFPSIPPDITDSVWHGSTELWTRIPADGPRWVDLPQNTPGLFTQKVFWWADGYNAIEEPAAVVVTATNLGTGEEYEFSDSDVTGGFRPDIGHFMIAGVELAAGCWELTGEYQAASTSFVAEIVGS